MEKKKTKAQVTWVGPGLRVVGEANDGPAIVLDSAHAPYGTSTGPAPMDLVLIGLAGCTAMDVVSIMAKKRQPLTGLQVKVEAERAEQYPQVYTKIDLEYVAYGKGVELSALERAVSLSEEKYCGVTAMLRHSAVISRTIRVVEDQAVPKLPGEPVGV